MSIQLDQTPALVVIDLQEGLRGYPTVHPFGDIVDNAAKLAEAFRAKGLPVVLVNVAGTAPGRSERNPSGGARQLPPEATALIPELNQQPSDIRVTKTTLGAFLSTDLDDKLKAVGATQVVLTGISTTSGVESTARSAYELGYHVGFVLDAMTDTSAGAHDASIEHQFPKLGELGTTAEVLAALSAR